MGTYSYPKRWAFAWQCENFVERYTAATGLTPYRASETLQWAIESTGYKLVWARLPEHHFGLCDASKRLVRINAGMRKTLAYPKRFEACLAYTLAHELAHIVLHGERLEQGLGCGPREEREANVWAVAYLIPRTDLIEHPSYEALRGASDFAPARLLWRHVLQLADRFGVSGSTMGYELQRHGLVTMPRSGGEISKGNYSAGEFVA